MADKRVYQCREISNTVSTFVSKNVVCVREKQRDDGMQGIWRAQVRGQREPNSFEKGYKKSKINALLLVVINDLQESGGLPSSSYQRDPDDGWRSIIRLSAPMNRMVPNHTPVITQERFCACLSYITTSPYSWKVSKVWRH